MIDHHTLLVVAGFALGSIVHQAVSHYNVPVLMLARAAVAKAQRTIVEAFEGDLSEDCPSDAEDASYAEASAWPYAKAAMEKQANALQQLDFVSTFVMQKLLGPFLPRLNDIRLSCWQHS